MALPDPKTPALRPVRSPAEALHVLVVDDSRFQRRLLVNSLSGLGYRVSEADSGLAALDLFRRDRPDLVLSDWMMPGMTGLDLCGAIRALEGDGYAYFIILTSKNEKGEIARGLDAGADDFLSKPVDRTELLARLRAGERTLAMQRELRCSNSLLTETLSELQQIYDSIERDLQEAKKLQQSLVHETQIHHEEADVSLLLRSAGHVGGDLVGTFRAGRGKLGLYGIDVSGHGISSALMTARLAGYLSDTAPDQNIGLLPRPGGGHMARPPGETVRDLNALVLEELATEHYFTFILLIVDLASGEVTATQAGHPHPALLRRDGTVEFPGDGGFPVGLLADVEFYQVTFRLAPGDRLLLVSDGITECPDPGGSLLDETGLARLMRELAPQRGATFLDALVAGLADFAGSDDFRDDVSAILLDYRGPGAR